MKDKTIIGAIFLFMVFLSLLFISACNDQGNDDTSLKNKNKDARVDSIEATTPEVPMDTHTETAH